MSVLAIDCASSRCAVAILDSETHSPLAGRAPEIGRGHAEILPDLVKEILAEAGQELTDIERICVNTGPGSFAGIRVGVSFARGLALSLGAPAVGVSGLYALAAPLAADLNKPVMAAFDAKRERIWAAIVAPDGRYRAEPCECTTEDAAAMAVEHQAWIAGTADHLIISANPHLQAAICQTARPEQDGPDIVDIARIGAKLDPATHPAEPVYLRAPDAKPQTGFAVARAR